jgi:microcystin-dependent protein
MSQLLDIYAGLTGTILPTVATSAPAGWLLCDGSAVSRTNYANLFNIVGTAFGTGDGSTTFNLPDLRGRSIIGVGTGSGLTARARGDTGGAETHTLTEAQMPLHGHPVRNTFSSQSTFASLTTGGFPVSTASAVNSAAYTGTPSNTAGQQIGGTGGNGAHNNMQPFMALSYIIRAI